MARRQSWGWSQSCLLALLFLSLCPSVLSRPYTTNVPLSPSNLPPMVMVTVELPKTYKEYMEMPTTDPTDNYNLYSVNAWQSSQTGLTNISFVWDDAGVGPVAACGLSWTSSSPAPINKTIACVGDITKMFTMRSFTNINNFAIDLVHTTDAVGQTSIVFLETTTDPQNPGGAILSFHEGDNQTITYDEATPITENNAKAALQGQCRMGHFSVSSASPSSDWDCGSGFCKIPNNGSQTSPAWTLVTLDQAFPGKGFTTNNKSSAAAVDDFEPFAAIPDASVFNVTTTVSPTPTS